MNILSHSLGRKCCKSAFLEFEDEMTTFLLKISLCVMTPPVSSKERRNSWLVGIFEQKIIDYVVI